MRLRMRLVASGAAAQEKEHGMATGGWGGRVRKECKNKSPKRFRCGSPFACGSRKQTVSAMSMPLKVCASMQTSLKDVLSKSRGVLTPVLATVAAVGMGMTSQ